MAARPAARRLVAALCGGALLIGACGDDDGEQVPTTLPPGAGDEGTETTADEGGAELPPTTSGSPATDETLPQERPQEG